MPPPGTTLALKTIVAILGSNGSAIAETESRCFDSGFWETIVHPLLTEKEWPRNVIAKKGLVPQLVRALPYLTLFALIWAWGEAVGYMFGPGDALSRIE